MDKMVSIHIIALGALGGGLSGGDRIFIEFARRWSKNFSVIVYVWEEGLQMCQREHLKGIKLRIKLIKVGNLSKLGFIFTYLYRIFLGLKLGFSLKVKDQDLIYSASEFWMDSLPAFLLKVRHKKCKWIAAWYQTAPNPLKGFAEGKRKNSYRFSAFLYWFMQKPIKPIISRFADFILVNNEFEKKHFSQQIKKRKIFVVKGAVNTEAISNYLNSHKYPEDKKYLAVFQGRFHPQKGVEELVEIWKLVTQKIPDARLAMIGDGPLTEKVKERIKQLHLEDNIKLFGYLHDGDKKYSIFQNSKIVVHPSFYDSGGMAILEAMSFGLPCVGFNLKSYSLYYPQGMLKVPIGDIKKFGQAVIKLCNNNKLYLKIGSEAKKMVLENFSWEKRIDEILGFLRTEK